MASVLWLLAAGGGHADGLHGPPPLLDPGIGLTFWSVVTFGVVLIVLKNAAWGPLQKALDDREARIRDALSAAERARAEAAQAAVDHEARLEKSRKEAEAILEEARKDAQDVRNRAHDEARKESEEVKARALKDIEQARTKAIEDLRQETVDLAMLMATRVLKAEVEAGRHGAIIDEVIGSWGKN